MIINFNIIILNFLIKYIIIFILHLLNLNATIYYFCKMVIKKELLIF